MVIKVSIMKIIKHIPNSLSRKELAKFCGVSRRTLYVWFKKSNIQLDRGLLTPKSIEQIFSKIGAPSNFKGK